MNVAALVTLEAGVHYFSIPEYQLHDVCTSTTTISPTGEPDICYIGSVSDISHSYIDDEYDDSVSDDWRQHEHGDSGKLHIRSCQWCELAKSSLSELQTRV